MNGRTVGTFLELSVISWVSVKQGSTIYSLLTMLHRHTYISFPSTRGGHTHIYALYLYTTEKPSLYPGSSPVFFFVGRSLGMRLGYNLLCCLIKSVNCFQI